MSQSLSTYFHNQKTKQTKICNCSRNSTPTNFGLNTEHGLPFFSPFSMVMVPVACRMSAGISSLLPCCIVASAQIFMKPCIWLGFLHYIPNCPAFFEPKLDFNCEDLDSHLFAKQHVHVLDAPHCQRGPIQKTVPLCTGQDWGETGQLRAPIDDLASTNVSLDISKKNANLSKFDSVTPSINSHRM